MFHAISRSYDNRRTKIKVGNPPDSTGGGRGGMGEGRAIARLSVVNFARGYNNEGIPRRSRDRCRDPIEIASARGTGWYVFSRTHGKSRGACTYPIVGRGADLIGSVFPVPRQGLCKAARFPEFAGICTRWYARTLGFQVQDRHLYPVSRSLNSSRIADIIADVREFISLDARYCLPSRGYGKFQFMMYVYNARAEK